MSDIAIPPPPVGTILPQHGKSYELVAIEPYVRKTDGAATTVLRFTGQCRHPDCAVPVEPSIGVVDYFKARPIWPTSCPEHKHWKARRGGKRRGRPKTQR